MRYATWVKTFEPIKNHVTPHTAIDGFVFLKDGRDMDFIRKQPKQNVWTFIVSDEGQTPVWLISDGIHFINAMGYLVTRKPREGSGFYDVRY